MKEILDKLNDEQRKAVVHKSGPLLIVAGAGTGKTTVITNRVAWLVMEEKMKPNEILALTFTQKAAEEMEERVDKLLPFGYEDIWINTFHEFGKRVLEEHAIDIGIDPGFQVLSQTDQYLFIRENLFEFDLDYFRPLGNPTKFIFNLVSHFSRAKDEEIYPEDYVKYAAKLQGSKELDKDEKKKAGEIAKAYKTYQDLMAKNNFMDFGDLLLYTLKLFRTRPAILKKFQRQFKYVLVDEFQDTNFSQYKVIEFIAKPENNITVVGDDDQSIYRWRGAALTNILNFKKDFPNSKEIVLRTNYRSPKTVVDAAYSAIQGNNPYRLETKLNVSKKLETLRSGMKPEFVWQPTIDQEAIDAAKKIVALKKEGKYSWKDFAILVRANAHAEPFLDVLERNNIPYQFVASRGLYSTPEIIDLISYLKVVDNFMDNISMYRAVSGAIFNFDTADLTKILNYSRKKTISMYESMEALKNSMKPKTQKSIEKLFSLLEKHSKMARTKPISEILLAFLRDSDYLDSLQARESLAEEKRFLNIAEFFKHIKNFEQTAKSKLVKDFINHLELSIEAGEDPAPAEITEGPDAVKVLTVHKAKGLEFPVVFVVALVDGMFPSRSKKELLELPKELVDSNLPEESHDQEERRLFYVAITRSQDRLFLSGSEDVGGKRKRRPSRFVSEIEDDIKEVGSKMQAALFDQKELVKPAEQKEKAKFFLPRKFSFTQLTAFSKCPLQYKFAHIIKIPTDGSAAQSYGKSIHNTLKKFFELIQSSKYANGGSARLKSPTLPAGSQAKKDLLNLFEENWIGDWYKNKKHKQKRFDHAKKALGDFFDKNKDNFDKAKFIEKEFTMKLGNYSFRGFMDRVDKLPDNTYEIIDYKTGDSKKGEREIKNPIQLLLYAKALKEVMGKTASKLTLYYVDENKSYSLERFGKKIKKAEEKAKQIIDQINESDFTATPDSFTCKYCDFKLICPDRK